ncbi:MAG: TPM domain-containing protein [Actinobacteria bacterium]|nr:TPM domain-containing protein [Actinomycetota bacterium]
MNKRCIRIELPQFFYSAIITAMEDSKNNSKGKKSSFPSFVAAEETSLSAPEPVADRNYFEFNDVRKNQVKHGHFILRNIGGKFKNLDIFTPEHDSFLKIVEKKPVREDQPDRLPVKICFEAKAMEWSKRYTGHIIIKFDDAEEIVTVKLDTQTKPLNDFAEIIKPGERKKITALIVKLERTTSAEAAVVTVDSLEGKTIEKYATDLFNEWGIGKEDKNNGLLFIVDTSENKYRIEVGLGLEDIISEDFIKNTFKKYVVPNFKLKKFGYGIYLVLSDIFAEIYRAHKKITAKVRPDSFSINS